MTKEDYEKWFKNMKKVAESIKRNESWSEKIGWNELSIEDKLEEIKYWIDSHWRKR